MAGYLDELMPSVMTQDTGRGIQAHSDLVPYLQDPHSSLACDEMDKFVDGLAGWVSSSNFKVRIS